MELLDSCAKKELRLELEDDKENLDEISDFLKSLLTSQRAEGKYQNIFAMDRLEDSEFPTNFF